MIRDSEWRRHLIILVIMLAVAPFIANLALGSWVFYKERASATEELARLAKIPQVGMVPHHADRVEDERHAGEQCLVEECKDTGVSIEQKFLFPGDKSAILAFYDKAFRLNGWGWSRVPGGASYDTGRTHEECVSVKLQFEQENLYSLTYTPICSWERRIGG